MSREAVAKAQALLDVGRPDEAAALLSQALAADSGDWHAWCVLAIAHLRCKRPQNALGCAQRAIELRPTAEWPHRITSLAELTLGHHAKAVAAAREAVRLAPHAAYPHAQLATALSHDWAWHWREAAREADRALEVGSLDAEIHRLAGDVALKIRRRRLAQARYEKALELDPSDSLALNNLGVARLRRGSPIAAATGFSRAAVLDPATDLHRRNLDNAVKHTLAYAVVMLGAAMVAAGVNRTAGVAALVLIALIGTASAVRARRMLGRAAWAYAMRVPFTNGSAGYLAVVVAVEAGLVAVYSTTGVAGPPTLVFMCLVMSARTLIQLTYQRIAG